MLTQCPACSAIFRLHAADLTAAHGFVECGACGETFNALLRLADEAPAASDTTTPMEAANGTRAAATPVPAANRQAGATGEADVAAPASPRETGSGTRAAESTGHPKSSDAGRVADASPFPRPGPRGESPLAPGSRLGPRTAVHTPPPSGAQGGGSAPAGTDQSVRAPTGTNRSVRAARDPRSFAARAEVDLEGLPPMRAAEPAGENQSEVPRVELRLDDAPAILREDLTRLRRGRSGAGAMWAAVALLLLVALGAQIAWTYREPLLARYPEARSHLERTCEQLGCRLDVPDHSGDIELVARDVRAHPQYAHTLLVNANLANRGDEPAAYPVVQLALLDSRGAYLGVRRFAPDEYLDVSIDVDAGLPPGRTVYIVLEVADGADTAAGFEFDFF